jgi:prevent-host-death family protein
MKVNEVSMVELRNKTEKVLQGLRKGESYCLTYRGKRLAKIIPEKSSDEPSLEDPLYCFHELAAESKPLTDREMDADIYELR